MELLAWTLVGCFVVHLYFQERYKKKLAYLVHIQERTEEAETLDFAVSLFEGESHGKWLEKLEAVYKLCEDRRAYNNKRVNEEFHRIQEQAKADLKKQ